MLSALNALVTITVNVRDVSMVTTYQEQLATSVMLTALLAMEQPRLSVADAQKATFWMSPATAQSRNQTLGELVGNTAIRTKLDGIMY